MAGMTDVFNRLSLALSLWNGVDPILKERMFGLTNQEGNHGEDVKEYWWYLDARAEQRLAALALPLPAGRRSRTSDLIEENRARSKLEPEFELLDTGIFDDDRYWIVEVHYAKATPTDILMRVRRPQPGPGGGDAARPADTLVPQRVGVEPGGSASPASPPRRTGRASGPSTTSSATTRSRSGPAPDGTHAAGCCSARTRRTVRGSRARRRRPRSRRTASTTTS